MMDEQASISFPLQSMEGDKHRRVAFSILKTQPHSSMRPIKLFATHHPFFMLFRKHCQASILRKMQQCLISSSFTFHRHRMNLRTHRSASLPPCRFVSALVDVAPPTTAPAARLLSCFFLFMSVEP
jgi:hypothetical protein